MAVKIPKTILTPDEIETCISQTKNERTKEKVYYVYTNDPYHKERLKRQGCIIQKEEEGVNGGLWCTIEHRQVTIRSEGKKSIPLGLRRTST